MQRQLLSLLALPIVLLATIAALPRPASAVWGVPDRVPGATLLLPFFETGVDSTVIPDDTLIAIQAYTIPSKMVRINVWSQDGKWVTGYTSTVQYAQSISYSMRDLISPLSAATRNLLLVTRADGQVWRGFLTIDGVTAVVGGLRPTQQGYPFSTGNDLIGFAYYTRLSKGSASGISMVPLEATSAAAHVNLRGFYATNPSDVREEIDADARACAGSRVANGTSACPDDSDHKFGVASRYFRLSSLNGTSRFVVFVWNTLYPDEGGPSAVCANHPGLGCATTYTYRRFAADGSEALVQQATLPHVVNVIDVGGNDAASVSILGIPDNGGATQFFALSLNSANPGNNPNLTWDALFEGFSN